MNKNELSAAEESYRLYANLDYSVVEERIGHKFKNLSLLIEALTHSSFANEMNDGTKHNERMEFLGDAVLSALSADLIYKQFPDAKEGSLSQMRANLVCTEALSGYAKELDLGSYLRLGKGERVSNGIERPAVLEDAFEAVVAAIYLDGGITSARKFVTGILKKAIKQNHVENLDYKSRFQVVMQKNPEQRFNYVIVGTSGPPHDMRFEAELRLDSNVIGRGIGKSKKSAEQEAARDALSLMGL